MILYMKEPEEYTRKHGEVINSKTINKSQI